jgi:hypothetical protein
MDWFSTKAQIIQTAASALSAWRALFKARPSADMPSSSADQAKLFTVQDVYFEANYDPSIVYNHKLRIVLRNESGKDLIVSPAKWETSTGDIATQPLNEHPWRLEGRKGWETGDWGPERRGEPVYVRPGAVLQTWIGLLQTVTEVEVRRRQITHRLGTLVIHLKIDRKSEQHRIRL